MDNKKINFIQTLFFLVSLIWIFFGLNWLWSLTNYAGRGDIAYFNSSVMLINSLIILVVALLMRKKKVYIYWFAVSYLLLNMILTVTDDFGFYDLITFIVESIVFIFLINYRLHLIKKISL